MRFLTIAILVLFPLIGYSQRTKVEETAMDFYIKNIREKGDKLKSTGKLEIEKGNYVGYVVGQYLLCKRRQAADSAEIRFFYNEYMRLGSEVKAEMDTLDLKDLTIRLKDPIKKVDRFKFQKLRGGLIGLCRRMTNGLFW